MKLRVVLGLLFAGLWALPAHADVTWAYVGPLSGAAAYYGDVTLLGAQTAIEDLNKHPAKDRDQKIMLKTFDTACDPKQAVAVANKVIAENIKFVIMSDCSGSSIAAEKIYADENILVINSLASNPKFTDEGGATIFRGSYRDDKVAPKIVEYLIKNYKGKAIAVLHDRGAYGEGIADEVKKGLLNAGLAVTVADVFDENAHDYSSIITRLKQQKIEVLFIGSSNIIGAAALARQIGEAGLRVQIVGGDLSDHDFQKIAGEGAAGTVFVLPHSHLDDSGVSALKVRFDAVKKSYNDYTLYTYAAAQVLAQAGANIAGADPTNVAAVMHKMQANTILGEWFFDAHGDIQNMPMAINRWHNGSYSEVKE